MYIDRKGISIHPVSREGGGGEREKGGLVETHNLVLVRVNLNSFESLSFGFGLKQIILI